jgi:beta-glucosidase
MKNRTYRYYQGEALFPFGYGLSYTTFAYSGLKISPAKPKAGEPVKVTATVKNTGAVAGDEVAELYLNAPNSPNAPIRALKGFKRVTLAPGASMQVEFTLDARDLSAVGADGARSVLPGDYRVSVGGSQPGGVGHPLDGSFPVHGTETLPK